MTETDLPAVAQIFQQVFSNQVESWSYDNALKHLTEDFFGPFHYVAIDEDQANQIIGFTMGIPFTTHRGSGLLIDLIAVASDYQRHNIGNQLLEHMLSQAKMNQVQDIRLHSKPDLPAFDWYRRCGFKESGWIELEMVE